MKIIRVVGFFGYKDNHVDGQSAKTRQVYNLICKHLRKKVKYTDTQEFHYNKIRGVFNILLSCFGCSTYVYLPGQNNLKLFFPIIYWLSRFLNFEIVYPVVGGWLPEFICNRPKLVRKLKNISAIFVESHNMREKLVENYNLENVQVLPNFRDTDFRPNSAVSDYTNLKLVFMARICKEKGCDYILDFAEKKHNEGCKSFTVCFYGPIQKDYESDFIERIKGLANVKYGGVVKPSNVYEVLERYDCLLLPTYYEGEGFPGTIVDSFIAGVPVVITDWKDLATFVEDGSTGFIVKPKDLESLSLCLDSIIANPQILKPMRQNCIRESSKFSGETAWEIISPYIK